MRWGVMLGVVAAVGLRPATGGAAVLEHVRLVDGSPARIELALSAPVVPWVRRLAASAQSPARIYVDLPDTVLGPKVARLTPCRSAGLTRIRTGQFTPTTARIVLDATSDLAYDVEAGERRVVIRLGGGGGAPDAHAAAPAPPGPPPPAGASRSEAAAPSPTALPLVVVDAGHGGHDPGAKGIGGVLEKTVVLQIAHRLAAKLPARLAVDSLLTRSDDSFVPLAERLVRRDAARTVFLSLHANACDAAAPQGLEIFFGSGGRRLARLVTDALRTRLIRVRGHPRPGPFTVLTANDAPSVLVELGYLTHPRDAARLQDPRYQELLTDALVDAVAAFLQSSPVQTVQNHHGA